MTTGDLPELGIAELAPLLRSRRLSPVELTAALLARIERLDPRLNCFIHVMGEQALAAARAAEDEIGRGAYRGPLHGVPVGLKDLFEVAGVPCTFGSEILRANVPAEDATVVERLRAAGAILLGKQNLHEFAFGVTSENPHYGDVRNPWDRACVAGGSSGGTAAAIAAGLCPAGLGSDTGGSIRIPASLCGVAGLKPTYGRVSRAGVLPLSWSLDHVGPLGRGVAECAALLQAVAGGDPRDPSALAAPAPDFSRDLEAGVAGLRLGVPRELYFETVDPAVADVVRGAIASLEGLGARLEEVSLPHVAHSQVVGTSIMSAEAASWHGAWLRERAADYGPDVLLRIRGGLFTLATEYLKAQRLRTLIQADFAAAFRRVDALVAPSVPIVAPEIGTTFEPRPPFDVAPRGLINRLTVPANLAGIPAASVPCGFVGGRPVGLQVIGPAYAEAMVLRVARGYERATAWHGRRPPLAARAGSA